MEILNFVLKVVNLAPQVQGIIGAGITLEQTVEGLVHAFNTTNVDPKVLTGLCLKLHSTWFGPGVNLDIKPTL